MGKVKELKINSTLWIQRLKQKFIRHVYKMVTKQINLKIDHIIFGMIKFRLITLMLKI